MRKPPRLVRLTAVAVISVVGIVVLLVSVPDKTLAWIGAVFTAAAAALGKKIWDLVGEAVKSSRAARGLEVAEPFVTDVKVKNVDYVAFADGDRIEEVPASGHTVQLVVTGALPKPVLLTDLRVEVTSRTGRSGALSPHAAEVPKRRFEVLLDVQPPIVRALGDSDFPFAVKPDESEAFDLMVTTGSGDVRWVLWLGWRCGSRSGSMKVDLGGSDFRTAGRHARPAAR